MDTDKVMASAQNAVANWIYSHSPQIIRDWLDRREERAMATEQSEQHRNRHGLKEMADGLGLPPADEAARREVESLSLPLIEENPFHALYFPLPENADRTLLETAANAISDFAHPDDPAAIRRSEEIQERLAMMPDTVKTESITPDPDRDTSQDELLAVQQEAADMRAQALVAYEQAISATERADLRSQAAELTVLMDAIQGAIAGSERVSLGQAPTPEVEPLIERIEAIGVAVEVEAPAIAREENEHQQDVER